MVFVAREGERLIRFRLIHIVALSMVMVGCAATQKHATAPPAIQPALESDQSQLVASYNRQADAIRALNASVLMTPTAGSAYSGVIHQYHQVSGFVLAARPALIRVIGQAPVIGTNIFDMVSDGQTFRIFIPSRNEFLVGPTQLERATKNPIENLRPQHLLDALFWTPIQEGESIALEQVDVPPARYYVLTVLRGSAPNLEMARKIWFDRADLRVSKMQIYGPLGRLDSDITYAGWQDGQATSSEPKAEAAGPADSGMLVFPTVIQIVRPQQDYRLSLNITKLALNADIPADRFHLAQPAGTELVNLDAGREKPQP